jgi:hypothetical protein
VLPISSDDQTAMRRDMLLGIVHRFHPDLLVVDHTPAGLAGELTPSLLHLRASSLDTRFVAGFRDIVGDPPRVRAAWARDGVHELLDDLYDRILVYGEAEVFDLVAEIGLSAGAAAKVRYTGYLGRVAEDAAPSETREQLGLPSGPLVLATAGGGADGASVLGAMLEALGRWPERARFHCLLVGGPLMSADDRRRPLPPPGGGPVRRIDHVDDLDPYGRRRRRSVPRRLQHRRQILPFAAGVIVPGGTASWTPSSSCGPECWSGRGRPTSSGERPDREPPVGGVNALPRHRARPGAAPARWPSVVAASRPPRQVKVCERRRRA